MNAPCTVNRHRLATALLPRMLIGLMVASTAWAISANPAPTAQDSPRTAEAAADTLAPQGATFRYLRINGNAFQSRGNDTFESGMPGCIKVTAVDLQRLRHKVMLPEGALIKYLRIYYYDASPLDLTVWLTAYDGAGGYTDLTDVRSSGSGGFDTEVSPEMSVVVDHASQSLAIEVNPGIALDETLQFCGARIAYYPIDSDRIFKNGFDGP